MRRLFTWCACCVLLATFGVSLSGCVKDPSAGYDSEKSYVPGVSHMKSFFYKTTGLTPPPEAAVENATGEYDPDEKVTYTPADNTTGEAK